MNVRRRMLQRRDGTAVARGINIFDSEPRTSQHSRAPGACVGVEGAQELHQVSIYFNGNESLSVRIEARHCSGFTHERAFECERRCRCKTKCEIPDGRDNESLERPTARNGYCKQCGTLQRTFHQQAGCAQSKTHAEQRARRHEREERLCGAV